MARILDSIYGQSTAIEQLWSAWKKNRLPHTLLFVGPSGVGKRKVASALAQTLLCEHGSGCGQCGSCLRVEAKRSESVLAIEADGAQIKVEQGREIIRFLSLQKIGRARVVIVDEAHLLNIQAANSLLKTLEEPPEGTYIILLTSQPFAILPTIRSRAQVVRFVPLSAVDLAKITKAAKWVIASSQGRADQAIMLSDPEWSEIRDRAFKSFSGLLHSNQLDVNELKDLTKDRNAAFFCLGIWQKVLRDALVFQTQSTSLINSDQEELLRDLAEWPQHVLEKILALTVDLEMDLQLNVDKTLALENLLVQAEHLIQATEEQVWFYGLD